MALSGVNRQKIKTRCSFEEPHENALCQEGDITERVDWIAVLCRGKLGGSFTEGQNVVLFLAPARIKIVCVAADLVSDGLDVRGGNPLLRCVEVSDDAGLAVRDVLVHGRIIVGDDAFAAGDLLEKGHADALLGARGDVHAEAVEERGVFLGRQEFALYDELIQRVGFEQRADR